MGKIHREWYDKRGRKHTLRMTTFGIKETISDPDQKGSDPSGNDHWYKKPIGIVALSVTGGLILILIGAALRHFFPGLFRN